jgi:hypothetical protein
MQRLESPLAADTNILKYGKTAIHKIVSSQRCPYRSASPSCTRCQPPCFPHLLLQSPAPLRPYPHLRLGLPNSQQRLIPPHRPPQSTHLAICPRCPTCPTRHSSPGLLPRQAPIQPVYASGFALEEWVMPLEHRERDTRCRGHGGEQPWSVEAGGEPARLVWIDAMGLGRDIRLTV